MTFLDSPFLGWILLALGLYLLIFRQGLLLGRLKGR